MSNYICANCLFAQEFICVSSDLLSCPILNAIRNINDYPCARFKQIPSEVKRRTSDKETKWEYKYERNKI